jgi:ribosomal protein S6--L-glutamate ligase
VLEVNASPGLEGIEAASDVDIAGTVIDYIGGRFSGAVPVGRGGRALTKNLLNKITFEYQ